MKMRLLSTGFGLLFTLALLMPAKLSVTASDMAAKPVNVSFSCIVIQADGTKVNICGGSGGGAQPLDVSWNSGGG